MKKQSSLKKLTDFWIIPLLAGSFFSAGYEFTNRKFTFSNHSNPKKKALINENSTAKTFQQVPLKRNNMEASKENLKNVLQSKEQENKASTQRMNPVIQTRLQEKTEEIDVDATFKKKGKSSSSSEQKIPVKKSKNSIEKLQRQASATNVMPKNESKKVLLTKEEEFIEALFNSLPMP